MRHLALVLLVVLAGCGSTTPDAECDPGQPEGAARLSCELGVKAALAVLPADRPQITRVQFLFGSATPCCNSLYPSVDEPPVKGYVVFTYEGGYREFISVTAYDGRLEVDEPRAY